MSFPGEYFERAFGNGRVKVNGEVVGVEYCVREGLFFLGGRGRGGELGFVEGFLSLFFFIFFLK